ncbi:MAG: EAL domain-containing protein [Burkholderiales bacterium]|nr:EAL domain-containing protein [Burkholderiales bacterium]
MAMPWADPCRAEEALLAPNATVMIALAALLAITACMVITRYRKLERRLQAEPARVWAALSDLREGVIATDAAGRIIFLNKAAEDLTGWTAADALGQPMHMVYRIIDEHSRATLDYIGQGAPQPSAHGDPGRAAVRLIRRDGQESSVHDSFSQVQDGLDGRRGYAVVFHDVSQLRALAQQLSWQASHDSLTGLVNRRELESRLGQLLDSAHGQGRQHVLLYIDLDNFKIVNDSCGHAAGDELLRSLTSLMSTKIRGSDTLARLGGDEFAALLETCPLDQGLRIANAIREVVRDFRFVWEGRSFAVGASIGLVPLDAASGDSAEVLTAADTCCYEAKNKGRDRVQVHRRQQGLPRDVAGEPQMIARLSHAFENGDFVLYQQYTRPLKAAVSSPHFEVLVRMRGENGELVPPMAFIPAAERYNLLTAIDRLVITELLQVLAARQRAGASPLAPDAGLYSVNLSGASINDSSFAEFVRRQLARFPVPASLLCFEVTETTAISNLTKAAELMHELKAMGCRFALDDFGIGMSSFAYLKYLPVDFLKIDGTFVRDMANDEMDCAIVEAINRIAHILGMQTVAEIVEDQATLDRLCRLGVDYAQGFYIARPEPLQAEMPVTAELGAGIAGTAGMGARSG